MSDVTNHADSFYVNIQQVNSQRWPDSVGLDNGNFAVTWVDFESKEPTEDPSTDNASGGHPVVKVQLFNKYGTKIGAELAYQQAQDYEHEMVGINSFYEPKVTALADGRYAIAYNYVTAETAPLEGY